MSIEKNKFIEVWERIKQETDLKTMGQLAELIGKTQQNISAAKKKDVFPPEWAFNVWERYRILTEWIMTGEGPKKIEEVNGGVDKTVAFFLRELECWARESSGGEDIAWLENQIEACFPAFKIWRDKKASAEMTQNQCLMDEESQEVTKDDRQMMEWYLEAAKQGHAQAQFRLGLIYDYGRNVPKDKRQAAKWYRKAAEQGHAKAQFNLGTMYLDGRGVELDACQAAEWYRKAAEQGHVKAQYRLGLLYDNGWGVPKDELQAVEWYRKAAEQGLAVAQYNLGLMYDYGRGVPKNKHQAVEWYRKAAEQGVAAAQFNLGRMYEHGQGVPKDKFRAAKWYRKAAEQGYAEAQQRIMEIMQEKG